MKTLIAAAVVTLLAGCAGMGMGRHGQSSGDMGMSSHSQSSGGMAMDSYGQSGQGEMARRANDGGRGYNAAQDASHMWVGF